MKANDVAIKKTKIALRRKCTGRLCRVCLLGRLGEPGPLLTPAHTEQQCAAATKLTLPSGTGNDPDCGDLEVKINTPNPTVGQAKRKNAPKEWL